MSFAILRTEKIKTGGNAGGLNNHLERTMEVPNADPHLTHLNFKMAGSNDLWKDITNRLSQAEITPRKNAVLAIEHLITYSPEWAPFWKEGNEKSGFTLMARNKQDDRKATDFFIEAKKWLEEQYGKENVVNIHVHLDESTPHMHAVVVPIDKKKKLNCREFLGGREKLRNMQTSFANRVKHLGLERGIEGSKAQHTTLKEFYGMTKQLEKQISKPLSFLKMPSAQSIQIDTPSRFMLDQEKWVKQQETKANTVLASVSSHFVHQFQENNSKVEEYVKKSFLKDYRSILELREQKYLNQTENALKAKFEGKNEVLFTKLNMVEQGLKKLGVKFDFESQNLVKIEQQKEDQNREKKWGIGR